MVDCSRVVEKEPRYLASRDGLLQWLSNRNAPLPLQLQEFWAPLAVDNSRESIGSGPSAGMCEKCLHWLKNTGLIVSEYCGRYGSASGGYMQRAESCRCRATRVTPGRW